MKKILSILLVLSMTICLMGALSTTVSAAAATKMYVGGVDVIAGGYWVGDGDGGITSEGASESNYAVKYVPDTGTLTLNNAEITKCYDWASDRYSAAIYVRGDLNIELLGNNIVTGKDNDYSYGVFQSDGTLTLSGSGTLEAIAGTATGYSFGINADSLAINDGTVIAKGGTSAGNSVGISAYGLISITDSTVTATGGQTVSTSAYESSHGLNSNGTIKISGGSVTATGGNTYYRSVGLYGIYRITISDDAIVHATGSTATDAKGMSYGIGTNVFDPSITISGGMVTAQSGTAPITSAIRTAPVLGEYSGCEWRISKDDGFSTDTYTWSESHTYVEFKPGFIPVNDIAMISADSVTVNTDLTLAGTITPANATNKTIVWSVEDVGTTGAFITDSTFRAASAGTARVKATVTNGLATDDYTKTFDITISAEPVVTHTITATAGTGGSISPRGNVTVNSGELQSFDITPNSNYSIADVKVDNVSQGRITSYTFDTVTADHTITATFSYNGNDSGSGGSSSDDDSSPVTITPPAPDKPNSPTQGEIKIPGTADSKGNVTVNITDKTVTDAFDKALADARRNGNEQNGITVVLRMDTGSKTGSNVTVNLPKAVQDTIIAKKIVNTIVVVDNPDIRIGMDLATVQEINRQAKSDVNITATRMDSGKLTGETKNAIGNRPIFGLKVNYGSGKQVQSFGAGSVSVTIPYTLGANEKAGNVQAVYVDSKGKIHWLANSVYDSVEKVLRFSTDHFSIYGIGYKQANTAFTDIAGHWAKEEIEFVVSRGLLSGTSTTTFSPNTAMTRGMFVTALGRLANADVSVYKQSSFTDVKNDAYDMGYIEWANKNNIINGIGDYKFAPDQSITRAKMAVIMSNYAKTIGDTLPKVHVENIFADNAKISAYAKEAVKQMQMAGVISVKNGNLFDPQGTATRAEVSAVLRRFVELAVSSDTAQGWTMNDSGKWTYYKNGKPVIGKKEIDGSTYTFDQYGVTADVPKNLRYTTYTVQKGDSFWLIAHKLGCTMSELERLNNKSRSALIHPGDVLRVPEK